MKIDRRSFLSLGIGAAAGTALSPLPWKSMDDSSIWSQNWPWTPVPPDGEITYEKSVCTLCPGGCGIEVRKIDDRVVKIEGIKNHPVNNGGTCTLGLSGPQLLYSPVRIKSPVRRIGDRFVPISWEKAILEITSKLSDLRKKGLSHTVACISGSSAGILPNLLDRFLTAYGSPNFISNTTVEDCYKKILKQMHGLDYLPGFDFKNTDLVLSFGSGLLDGWGSPVNMFKNNSHWKNNEARIFQIEPRLSNTAAKSEKWIPINPGTEADLALGISNVLIKEFWYDRTFTRDYSSGFEIWKQVILNKYNANTVSNITGVDEPTIRMIAKNFARASSPIAVCGRGQGHVPGNMREYLAVHALNALKGCIDRRGGIFAIPDDNYINWPPPEIDSIAAAGKMKKRIDGARSDQFEDSEHLLHRFPSVVNSRSKDAVQVLLISEANPCYTMPDSGNVKKAFEKIPLKVSFSPYFDETAKLADIILPNNAFLERYQDVPSPSFLMEQVVGLAKPVVKPQLDTKDTGSVIIAIAKKLGGTIADSFPWPNFETCLKKTLANKWEMLNEKGFITLSDPVKPEMDEKFDFSPLIRLIDTKIVAEGNENTHPLLLVPKDSMRLSSGFIGSPPFLMKTVPADVLKGNDMRLEINPATAKKFNLDDGDYARLSTSKGSAVVMISLSGGIKPGVVALSRGLGHTAYDDYLAGKGINFNELIGPVEDPATGFDAAWGIQAKLSKV